MRSTVHVITILVLAGGPVRARADQAQPFQPAPADQVPGYSAAVMPCKINVDEGPAGTQVSCKGDVLEHKSLRELSILRNTIYARYGWDGYRKPWLRAYFHAQKWFTPNPKFSYKLLTDADRKNAHFIAAREQSFTDVELRRMRDDIQARYAKGAEVSGDDKIELGLLARAMGSFALDDDARGRKEGSLDAVLPLAELRQLSLRDLRLLRNTIYAR